MAGHKIMSPEQIRCWWSECVRDPELDLKDRLKFSELLMKSQGGFREEASPPAKEEIHIGLEKSSP